jgi:drug/metabolite transporter (DMT)-like permease
LTDNNTWIAILIGIISTTQLHLAKALERQGIEVFEQLRAHMKKTGQQVEGGLRKPVLYTMGLTLNNSIFIYPLIAQRYAPPAVYTSMFGIGLVFLMIYAARVLKEEITRKQVAGSAAIIVGTLVIGVENILRSGYDRSGMALTPTLVLVGAFLVIGTVGLILASQANKPESVAVAFGLFCGGCGSLDPFLKGVAQNLSGSPEWMPGSWLGWAIFLPSFVIGFIAFAVTQVGFARKAPAGLLIPAYNASYILLPILLQVVLLPTYLLYWSTYTGMTLIILGMVLMRDIKR